jgi:NADH-quinone oxidoreductase subunit A
MSYVPVLILMLLGVAAGVGMLVASHFLGPKLPNRKKNQPFECGVPPVGDARHRISVRFYLVAILFLLFDVEVVFFIPWAVVFRKYLSINAFILIEMGVFLVILLVGYLYVLGKGALEWE